MNILIVKLGATGDVVRTTPLLRRLEGSVTWVTSEKNQILLQGLTPRLRSLTWDCRKAALDRNYELAINLEDDPNTGQFLREVGVTRIVGAYSDSGGTMRYTEDARAWFDLSLISRHGRKRADELKLANRRTYQDLIFEGVGYPFRGERYLLPNSPATGLAGDVAIAARAGPVWPMKNWAFYRELKQALEGQGLTVNVLPERASLLEHLADVRDHRCFVGGDSLPMHFALGSGVPCVTLFTCTSPWEIHDYGIQKKLVSPLLEEFFYSREFDLRGVSAIPLEEVFDAVNQQLAQRARMDAGRRETAIRAARQDAEAMR
jgi:heptosyltransferase-2